MDNVIGAILLTAVVALIVAIVYVYCGNVTYTVFTTITNTTYMTNTITIVDAWYSTKSHKLCIEVSASREATLTAVEYCGKVYKIDKKYSGLEVYCIPRIYTYCKKTTIDIDGIVYTTEVEKR